MAHALTIEFESLPRTAGCGRQGEAANSRFVEFKLAKIGFFGTAALEKVRRPFWVELSQSD
jgi:hypothetical protein